MPDLDRQERDGGSRPVPDPTTLTFEAIDRLERSLTTYINGEIKHLTALLEGEIRLTNERFTSTERLRVEQKRDTKDAVDAALAAAKEAVKEQTEASERSIGKSEQSTEKAIGALSDKIEDLKERVTRTEGTKLGGTEERRGAADSRVALYTTIGLIVTLVLFGFAIVGFLASHGAGA